MPWLTRNVYSKLSKEELEELLRVPGRRLLVADIDGTLHKGLLPGRYGGITYIDIALYLLPQLAPDKFLQFSGALARIFLSELKERREELHISQFVQGLQGVPESSVIAACQKTARNMYPGAVTVFQKLARQEGMVYLIGKALLPLAEAYARQLEDKLDCKVKTSSNPLLVRDGMITGLEKLIVSASQKATALDSFLKTYAPEQVIAFGDSREDAAFFSLPYPPQSLRVAMNPKDSLIKECADIWCWSWKDLHDVFFGATAPRRRWFFLGALAIGTAVYGQAPADYNEVLGEYGKMGHDWLTSPQEKELLLADVHVHVNAGISAGTLLDKIPRDVDIITLAEKTKGTLSYAELKQNLRKEQVDHVDRGMLVMIPRTPPLYIGRAEENCGLDFHILSVGHTGSIVAKETHESLRRARTQGGIVIVAHPYTTEETNPYLKWRQFRMRDEHDPTLGALTAQADALEVFNAQNMFWMCQSNVLARRHAATYHLPGIAGSDTHGTIEDIGVSGLYFAQDTLDFTSDKAFYKSLRGALKNGQFERREHYASPITFITTVALPYLHWYHGILLLGGGLLLGGKCYIRKKNPPQYDK